MIEKEIFIIFLFYITAIHNAREISDIKYKSIK